jgi:hypothetical protein
MESPQEIKKSKNNRGCTFLLIRVGIGVAGIFLLDYITSLAFQSAYPADAITTDLVPFQNHYLAKTDAFVTSEGMSTEFSDDPGAAARFLGLCILPFIGTMVLATILYIVPFTRKLVDYTWHIMTFAFVLLMIFAMFFPPVMTTFDRERKVMIVHRNSWMLNPTKTEIPFDQITSFTSEIDEVHSDSHVEIDYADLYANTTSYGKVFIGENQVGSHATTSEDVMLDKDRKMETEKALKALRSLVGID